MSRVNKTETYSIFGQIESVAAELLIKDNKAIRIPLEQIPESARYDAQGRTAYFAVIVPREHIHEFEKRIKNLYA